MLVKATGAEGCIPSKDNCHRQVFLDLVTSHLTYSAQQLSQEIDTFVEAKGWCRDFHSRNLLYYIGGFQLASFFRIPPTENDAAKPHLGVAGLRISIVVAPVWVTGAP